MRDTIASPSNGHASAPRKTPFGMPLITVYFGFATLVEVAWLAALTRLAMRIVAWIYA